MDRKPLPIWMGIAFLLLIPFQIAVICYGIYVLMK